MGSGQPDPEGAVAGKEHRKHMVGERAELSLRSQGSKTATGKAVQDVRSREDQRKFRKHSARQVKAESSR